MKKQTSEQEKPQKLTETHFHWYYYAQQKLIQLTRFIDFVLNWIETLVEA